MSFIAYDVTFLVLFTLLVAVFLYTRKHNLKREGLLYLYRTRFGLKVIEYTSKKYAGILRPMQYVVVASGYILMAIMIWMILDFSYQYLSSPFLAEQLRVPVLTPLVPYIDRLFAVDFLPPFYFTTWIVVIAIIAIPHEFAHGIFARLNRIKIHSTGFGFLGPFLAAFVEQDEKDMNKAKKFPQLAVLAAGTFANVITAILFALLLWLFVAATFVPAGIYFNTYSAEIVPVSEIQSINGGLLFEYNSTLEQNKTFLEIRTSNNKTYLVEPALLQRTLSENRSSLIAYEDAPAINAGLGGAITHIDGEKISSYDQLRQIISQKSPGQNVTVSVVDDDERKDYNIQLAEKDGKAYLGIGVLPVQASGIKGLMFNFISEIKDPLTYYESRLGEFGIFIYELLWWTVVICISVALVNMLPVGIFDGGRFFYLTVWGLTGSEKIGKKAFSISTWAILLLVAALMLQWVFTLF